MSQRSSAPSLSRTDEGGNPRRLETCHAPDENVYIQMLCVCTRACTRFQKERTNERTVY